jgi:putative tryptophan/tyrosine transport system substrate-binding protein
MNRREFIAGLASAAAWPLVARAQQAGKLPVIGYLASTLATESQQVIAFTQRLREVGWIEGRSVTIEYRWSEGRSERYADILAEFIRLKVDLILTRGTEAALAAKRATSSIPILAAVVGDPVGTGLVASLSRPGGNITALSVVSPNLASKRLELFREAVGGFRRMAILFNETNPVTFAEAREVGANAVALGIEVVTLGIRRGEEIAQAFDGLKARADALYIVAEPVILANIVRVNTLALGERLPTIYIARDYVQTGGLMSYGPNNPALYRRAAEIADKILRGTNPADIPVEQPTKFELVVNLTTARALGLTIPETILALADEVIQ